MTKPMKTRELYYPVIQFLKIAVVTVFRGLTYKRGRGVHSVCFPFASFVCLFKQKNIGPQAQL